MKFRCVLATRIVSLTDTHHRAYVVSRARAMPRIVWEAAYQTKATARYAADSMLRLYTKAHFGRK